MSKGTRKHLMAVSRTPVVAQTALMIKLNFIEEIVERGVLMHRQIPWKTYYPPNGAPDNGNGVGNGNDGLPGNGNDI